MKVGMRAAAVPSLPRRVAHKKRAACGCKRPKFREETPKEGGGSADATAPQQYATALHKEQAEKASNAAAYVGESVKARRRQGPRNQE
jgi:hypothetical protein